MTYLRSVAPLMVATALLHGANALAAGDWTAQTSIEQDFSYDTNPLLLTDGYHTLWGSTTMPKLILNDTSPTTQFTGTFWGSENIFNQSNFDSTDGHMSLNYDDKIERWELGFLEATDYDTTRTSELTTLNINTVGSVRHIGNNFTPTLSYNPTLVDKISLTGSVQDSRYETDLLSDYHIFTAGSSYQHGFTPQDTGIFSVYAQRFQTDSGPNATTDSITPTVGWTSVINQRLTLKANVGAEDYHPEGEFIPQQSWSWKATYMAELDYAGIADTLALNANRALQPYPDGTEFFLTTFSLNEIHTINSLFTVNLLGSYQFSDDPAQDTAYLKSLITGKAGLTYHATNKFDVTASYQYRSQELGNPGESERDNTAMVSLVYRPQQDKLSW